MYCLGAYKVKPAITIVKAEMKTKVLISMNSSYLSKTKKVITDVDYDLSVWYTVTAAYHKPNIPTVLRLPQQKGF